MAFDFLANLFSGSSGQPPMRYSYGPPSQRMFGGRSIYSAKPFGSTGRSLGSYLPEEKPRYYGSYKPPSSPWDDIADWLGERKFPSTPGEMGDFAPPLKGPNISHPSMRGGGVSYRMTPPYEPPMPTSIDVAGLLQLINAASANHRRIRRFDKYFPTLLG